MSEKYNFIPLDFSKMSSDEMLAASKSFLNLMTSRRTVRDFSSEPIPDEVINNAIMTAGSAPSGANMQPWHFVIIKNPEAKKKIREAAEEEEQKFL